MGRRVLYETVNQTYSVVSPSEVRLHFQGPHKIRTTGSQALSVSRRTMAEDNGDLKILATMRNVYVPLGMFHSFFMKGLIPGSSGEYNVRVMATNVDQR